jgi:ABC-type glycerol-3-phosphate transport system substrate-binding protein
MRPLLANALLSTTTALLVSLSGVVIADDAVVKVLTIGYPDEDSLDAVTGGQVPGIGRLKAAFETANPSIKLDVVNIPWGSGATGYAPKTEAMIKANEACLYEMPAAASYGRRGFLVNLDTMIAKDKTFVNVWGSQIDSARSWGRDNPHSLWYIPNNTGERVIHWDAKLFKDYGVEPLSQSPTLAEIEEKAPKLTGKNPVTGEQTYGYWYQGKYAVWQFMAIAHALGATWGGVDANGVMTVNWDTPEYLQALKWFVKMAQYAPKGALAGDGMPQGFLSDQNVVAIIPEGEPGYFLQPLISQPALRDRFRVSYNLKGSDGVGGLSSLSPLAMAASCENKDAAWQALKWLAGSPESQQYYFDSIGRLPVMEGSDKVVPKVAELPDGDVILKQPLTAEAPYPWAAEKPRWALQAALEAALAGTTSPEDALKQAQRETADWLAQQK